jgi:hypothetical protein
MKFSIGKGTGAVAIATCVALDRDGIVSDHASHAIGPMTGQSKDAAGTRPSGGDT